MFSGLYLLCFIVYFVAQGGTSFTIGRCLKQDTFDVLFGISFEDCISRCLERSLCLSVSYQRIIQTCFLRQNRLDGAHEIADPKRCFNLNIAEHIDEIYSSSIANSSNSSYPQGPCDGRSIYLNTGSEGFTCVIVYCNSSTTHIANAHFANEIVTSIGRQNLLQCDHGYTAFGQASVTCLTSGNFTETDFKCVKDCQHPPVKTGAMLNSWYPYRFTENTTANYVCVEGYYTLTTAEIVCGSDGKWSPFECTAACHHSYAPRVENGYVLPGTWYTVEDFGKYTCVDGHYLSPGNPRITCDLNGKWASPQIACYQYCTQATIPVIPNGQPKPGDLYNYTMQAEFNCSDGYYLSPGSPFLQCNTNGSWSSPVVKCYRFCAVPTPDNGIAEESGSLQYTSGQTVEYICREGFYLSTLLSVASATCHADGTWTYTAVCYKHCGAPPAVQNADITTLSLSPYTILSQAYYGCKSGYFPETRNVKRCQISGSWVGVVACCPRCHFYSDGQCKLRVWSWQCVRDFLK